MKSMIRKSLFISMLSLSSAILLPVVTAQTARAQQPSQTPQRTMIGITVTVERQQIVAGPYARYAQRYLGVGAPLADKVTHQVKVANIFEISELSRENSTPQNLETGAANAPQPTHMLPAEGFPRLTIDRTTAVAQSLEESARLAAEKIFEIRRSRLDLITGEVGENVFGGGLGSALAELSRLEEEYLSLFLGLQTSSTVTREFQVIPAAGRLTYIVCRFSDTVGLLPGDDMSGVPVVLELRPLSDPVVQSADNQARPSSRAIPQRIPADVQCRVIFEGTELASQLLSIRQMGEVIFVTP